MRENELKEIQSQIINNLFPEIDANDEPGRYLFTNYVLYKPINNKTIVLYSPRDGGDRHVATHEEAYDFINRVKNFYDKITDKQLEILMTPTKRCACCNYNFTLDHFSPVSKTITNALVYSLFFPNFDDNHIYCNDCIYRVSWITSHKKRPGNVYLMHWNGYTKIGRSVNVESRLNGLRKTYPGIALLGYLPVEDMHIAEAHLQTIFAHKHVENELFSLSDDDIDYIQNRIELR